MRGFPVYVYFCSLIIWLRIELWPIAVILKNLYLDIHPQGGSQATPPCPTSCSHQNPKAERTSIDFGIPGVARYSKGQWGKIYLVRNSSYFNREDISSRLYVLQEIEKKREPRREGQLPLKPCEVCLLHRTQGQQAYISHACIPPTLY